MGRNPRPRGAGASDHVEILWRDSGIVGREEGFAAPRRRRFASTRWPASPSFFATRSSDAKRTVHIIGAGIFRASRRPFGWRMRISKVHVHEGPRNRPAAGAAHISTQRPNLTIDNGNHLLLSGKPSRCGLRKINRYRGGAGWGRKRAQFPFVDLTTGQRWQLDPRRQPGCRLWVFDETRPCA